MQLSSHNCPNESKDEFCRSGKICAFVEDGFKSSIDKCLDAFDVMDALFGKYTIGPSL